MSSSEPTQQLSGSSPPTSRSARDAKAIRKSFKDEDDAYFSEKIAVPSASKTYEWFSWRKLWAFTGPGFLMSIAYLDPGNIESDLQSGAVASYKLLWVLFTATIFGLMMQRLAARLGVVSGHHLAEVCRLRYPKYPRYLLWILVEIAVVGSDMQEVIGTSIALFLISDGGIQVYWGVIITICDTFTFLLLDKYGLRKLECVFLTLITIMAGTFGYEYVTVAPPQSEVIKGLFIPWCESCNYDVLQQAVGIIGAVIMPHNLYLHSALVKSRKIDRRDKHSVSEANKYYFIESSIALLVSFIINIFVVSVFAQGLYGKTNADINDLCMNSTLQYKKDVFKKDDKPVHINIYKAGIYLGCQFGLGPLMIWAIGIFAAGQSSTMTGTYSGQFIMEGFLNLNIQRWLRVLITRTIAIGPTLLVSLIGDINQLSSMNDLLNALMSLQLPFALIPCITFVCHDGIMGDFKSGKVIKSFSSVLLILVIGIDLYFVSFLVSDKLTQNWFVYVLTAIFVVFYIGFILYLAGCLLVVFGVTALTSIPCVGQYLKLNDPEQIALTGLSGGSSDDTIDSGVTAVENGKGKVRVLMPNERQWIKGSSARNVTHWGTRGVSI
ncbi:natural resistance-associated macrophage protein 2-like isoform X2 [Varroa destructor]|uniref:Uncharacterized protein n=1 Tax=Varroa destructor TaxID=109461 RepID=A0A7M7J501_VARDE|nr:natural resistance-associated macrophage protein 2-like isoform X2 [Varroa destructor]XP_022646947.1 natural resistance-associated macrophage protein 2-like isoform X2 [Varroa destructor]XP_022646948.1 natural resistance-associated macrophage protein 2-like isoform X2 [Varroa destructor]